MKPKTPHLYFVLVISFGILNSTLAVSAGFDCTKATTHIEKMICADTNLSQLDSKMSDLYSALLKLPNNAQSAKELQKAWIKEQRNNCTSAQCLTQVYSDRISNLEKSLAQSNGTDNKSPDGDQINSTKNDVNTQLIQKIEGDKVSTKLGIIESDIDTNVYPNDPDSGLTGIIKLDGKPVYSVKLQRINLYNILTFKDKLGVLFGENAGGSGGSPDELKVLILPTKNIISSKEGEFFTKDRTIDITYDNVGNYKIDLGNEEGKRKFANLTESGVDIFYKKSGSAALTPKDCKDLYEYSKPCATSTMGCDSPLSNAEASWINVYADKSGFNQAAFDQMCQSSCTNHQLIGFDEFSQSICGDTKLTGNQPNTTSQAEKIQPKENIQKPNNKSEINETNILGTWICPAGNYFTFSNDLTFQLFQPASYSTNGHQEFTSTGMYQLIDGVLTLQFKHISLYDNSPQAIAALEQSPHGTKFTKRNI